MKFSTYSFLSFFFFSSFGWACDCKPNDPIVQEIPKYEAIFTGMVIARHSNYHEVKVEEPFKGVHRGETLKLSNSRSYPCHLEPKLNARYVWFMNKVKINEEDWPETWRPSLCSPTSLVKNAGKTLKELRRILRKKSSTGPE